MPSVHDLYLEPVDPGDEGCQHCGVILATARTPIDQPCDTAQHKRNAGSLDPLTCVDCCQCAECWHTSLQFRRARRAGTPTTAPSSPDATPAQSNVYGGAVVTPNEAA